MNKILLLLLGLGPTLIGYSVQGALKFGFYEIFKTTLMGLLAPQESGRLVVFMLAGGLADTIASFVLTPFEACRIRLVADPSFANGLLPCLQKITSSEGLEGLFRGLPAILTKQIPYTVVCLSVFETVASSTYSYLADHGMYQDIIDII